VLTEAADREPVPSRKFFHIGQPEIMDDVGECVPMISWVDDNLSRFVLANAPSSSWGQGSPPPFVTALPNHAVKQGEGVFLVTGAGEDEKVANPNGKGQMHFIHLGRADRLWDKGIVRLYVYRLEGVQWKAVSEKKA